MTTSLRRTLQYPSSILFYFGVILLPLNFFRFYGLAISDWAFILGLGVALIETLSSDRKNLNVWGNNKIIFLVAVILLGAVLSSYRSQNMITALIEIMQLMFVMTVFISFCWIMVRRGHTQTLINVFIFTGVFAASVALIDYYSGSNYGQILSNATLRLLGGRYYGPLGHPNKLGFYLVLSFIPAAYRLIFYPLGRASILFGIFCILQLVGIYLSGSVTAFIGLSFGLLVLVLKSGFHKNRFSQLIILLLLFLSSVIISVRIVDGQPMPAVITGIQSNIDRVTNLTASIRMETFRDAFDYLIDRPVLGYGFDQLGGSGLAATDRILPMEIHNIFLQVWFGGGLISLVGFIGIYIYLGLKSLEYVILKSANFTFGLAVCVLAFIVMDQFQVAIYQREKWLIVGLFLGNIWAVSDKSSTR